MAESVSLSLRKVFVVVVVIFAAVVYLTVTWWYPAIGIQVTFLQKVNFTPNKESPTSKCRNDPYGLQTNEDLLIPFFRKNGMKAEKAAAACPNEGALTKYEMELLSFPPLTDVTSVPTENLSRVALLISRGRYRVGDKIQLRVDLYDGRGRIRKSGGDEVRVWLVHPSRHLTSAAAEVMDLRNGSYLADTTLQWAGPTSVRVSLTYPREFLRFVVQAHHTLHSMRWITAFFNNKRGDREVTACLPSAPVPGFARTCNLTSSNAGMPWYCGHPTISNLTCDHWHGSSQLPFTPVNASSAEKQLIAKIDKAPYMRLIPNNITLHVTRKDEDQPEEGLPPCWSKPSRDTWEARAPRGWFQEGSWRPSTCALPKLTRQRVADCMRNTSMLLLGDSNSRSWWQIITAMTKCTRVVNPKAWHAPRLCETNHLNSSVMFAPHAMPFAVGKHNDLSNLPLPVALHQLPERDNIVVVVYYFAHFSTEAQHAFSDRVRDARKAIVTYLDTHPKAKVKVFIRGPHVLYEGRKNHVAFGDTFGPQYINMWKEEFRELYDSVWFLDYWDMTIASENFPCHPANSMVKEMVKILFGYFCDQE